MAKMNVNDQAIISIFRVEGNYSKAIVTKI